MINFVKNVLFPVHVRVAWLFSFTSTKKKKNIQSCAAFKFLLSTLKKKKSTNFGILFDVYNKL
uniref:Uncharacterized protein n=1 Tax=Anguilla anguilla TaxID=7936 RepID=A0A0E9XRI2_ANGAN